jgi:hypothetical protein
MHISVRVSILVFVLLISGCRGWISGAIPTAVANGLVGKSTSDLVKKIGQPDSKYGNVWYYGSSTRFNLPTTATTRVIGNTAYTTVQHGGPIGGTCTWAFYINESSHVVGWQKEGSDCATIY